MIKKIAKICVSICLTVVLALLVINRIVYVNTVIYSIYDCQEFIINEEFEYNGMAITVSEYKIYDGNELDSLYNGELTDIVDEHDIMFNLSIMNTTNEIKQYNAAASGIIYGYNSGGNVNPYLYQYFNPNSKGIVDLLPNESITITLAFPYEEFKSSIDYIVSLYPENIRVKIRKAF